MFRVGKVETLCDERRSFKVERSEMLATKDEVLELGEQRY